MALPKKISPCPIIDALIEVRFSTKTHPGAIFGIIYNSISDIYPNVNKLPITQLPDPITEMDPVLKYKPHFKVFNTNFVVQIGPNVVTVSSYPEYSGWSMFYQEIKKFFAKFKTMNLVEKIERVGVRYINFFEFNIFEKIELSIIMCKNNLKTTDTLIKTEINHGKYKSILNVKNNFEYKKKIGSIIDIDTSLDNEQEMSFDNIESYIKEAHSFEKQLFFNLLKQSFINELNPEF